MVVVDAIDERAVRFYEAHGFTRLPDSMRLVIPMRAIGAPRHPPIDRRHRPYGASGGTSSMRRSAQLW